MKNNELIKKLSFKTFLNESFTSWQRDDEYWKDSEYSYFEWQRYFRVTNEEIQKITNKTDNFNHRDETISLEYAHNKSKNYYIKLLHKSLISNLNKKLRFSFDQYKTLFQNEVAELFYNYFKNNSFDLLNINYLTENVNLDLINQILKNSNYNNLF